LHGNVVVITLNIYYDSLELNFLMK
jgi:hypothetical protein